MGIILSHRPASVLRDGGFSFYFQHQALSWTKCCSKHGLPKTLPRFGILGHFEVHLIVDLKLDQK